MHGQLLPPSKPPSSSDEGVREIGTRGLTLPEAATERDLHSGVLRGSVGLEYGLISLGLHCFLRLERALCWRSGRCLVGDAFSV